MQLSKQKISEFLLLIIIFVIVFFTPNFITWAKLNYFNKTIKMIELSRIPIDNTEGFSVYNYHNNIALATPNQITLYNPMGEKIKQRQLFGDQILIKTAQDFILIAETLRGDLALLTGDKLEVLAKKKDMGQISDILISSDGDLVISMQTDNKFYILDSNLNQKSEFELPQGEITSINLSNDGKTILLAVINLIEQEIQSFVYQYDLNGNLIGISDLNGDLVFSVYMNNNQIIVTDNKLISYNRESKKVAEELNMSRIDQSTIHKDFLYTSLISTDKNGTEQSLLSIFNDDFSYNLKNEISALPEKIIVNNKFIATYSAGVVYLYDHKLNSLVVERTERDLKGIQWLSENQLLCYDNSLLTVYSIK